MFLHIGQSNRDSEVIGRVFLNNVMEARVVPRMLRFDKGSETVHASAVQVSDAVVVNVAVNVEFARSERTFESFLLSERLWTSLNVGDGGNLLYESAQETN